MYDVQIQIAALCIVALLIYCIFSRKILHSLSDNVYLMLLFMNLINAVTSILATHMAYQMEYLDKSIIQSVIKLYLCSYMWIGSLIFLIVLEEIIKDRKTMHRVMHLTYIPVYFSMCYCLLFEVDYVLRNGKLYIEGPARKIAFIVTIAYLLVTILMELMLKKENRNRTNGIAELLIVIMLGIGINWALEINWKMDGICYVMVSVFLYLNITNADNHIDYSLGIFNHKAFEYYFKELYDNKEARILFISFNDFKGISSTFGMGSERILFENVVQSLSKVEGAKLFRYNTYQLAFIYDGDEKNYNDFTYAVKYKLRDDFYISNVAIKLVSYVIEVPINNLDIDYESFSTMLQFYLPEMIDMGKYELTINENHVNKKHEADQIQAAIALAIEEQNVEMYYQPIWNVNEKRYDSAEALLRLKDSDGNDIPAALAMVIAEESGQSIALGHLVFRQVFSFMNQDKILGKYLNKIHINLSCAQSANTKIVKDLTALMAEYKIAPSYVDLELKEQEQQLEDILLKDNMHSLLDYGNSFSLDDYGRGYANLTSIMEFPFQYVKLDKSLVHLEAPNEKAEVALHFVLDMATQLGMQVVAKGVESLDDLERMKKLNIGYMQGFYIAPPLPEKDFIKMLKNH